MHRSVERPVCCNERSFKFLNHEEHFNGEIEWNRSSVSKLWLYNLHYFDYLQQPGISLENGFAMIQEWIARNPPFLGNGWEPYTLSLRIVNWIKFLGGEDLVMRNYPDITDSIYLQARTLRRVLEYHLLANHLFKNGVALFFAGNAFEGKEAVEWCTKGKEILISQLKEQILQDGGHYERSPMYHAIILEDVLDCLNLQISIKQQDELFISYFRQTVEKMLGFMAAIVHEDGSLPRFNDTAEGIASSLEQLKLYAARLGVCIKSENGPSDVIEKPYFGLYTILKGNWRCIIDAGPIGPDYQPGHAHCDTLSFELSYNGKLFAVNAGTYMYAGPERNLFRSTRSHNTLEIDGREQHEIWSTFRVARRGYPRNVSITQDQDVVRFRGQHTGYERLPGRPYHQRMVQLEESGMIVFDEVISKHKHRVNSYVHLHPGVEVTSINSNSIEASLDGSAFLIEIGSQCKFTVEDYAFSPQFGVKQQAKLIVLKNNGESGSSTIYSIRKL